MEAIDERKKECKLYNGSDTFPAELQEMEYGFLFWEAEQLYVKLSEPQAIESTVGLFLSCGLAGAGMDNTPILLRSCLFELFCKGADKAPQDLAPIFEAKVLPKYLALP